MQNLVKTLLPTVVLMAGGFLSAGADVVTNVAALRFSETGKEEIYREVRMEAEVCSVSASGCELILADDSGAEVVLLDKAARVRPGDKILLAGAHCRVSPESWGVSLAAVPLINNDGLHGATEKSGKCFLPEGRLPLRLEWFNAGEQRALNFTWQPPGGSRERISSRNFFQQDETTGIWTKGLAYRCFEGAWIALPDFENLPPVRTGTTTNITLDVTTRHDDVGLEFDGFLQIDRAGEYTFFLESDDGARLFIGESPLTIMVEKEQPVLTPLRMEPGAALVSQDENRWTETAGVVQQVLYRTDCVTLQLSSTGGVVQALLPGRDSVPPRLLLDSKVVIRGVGRKIFRANGTAQFGLLEVCSAGDLHIEQLAAALEDSTPPTSLSNLLAKKDLPKKQVVRLIGEIRPGKISGEDELTDGTNSLPVVMAFGATPVKEEAEIFGWLQNDGGIIKLHCSFIRNRANPSSAAVPPQTVLTTAEQIQRLTPDEAKQKYPARIRGVIIGDAPELHYGSVIQDQTRGIYFYWVTTNLPLKLPDRRPHLGEFWEIEGATDPGSFAPVIRIHSMKYLGEGQLPEPLNPAWDQLIGGSLDTQWVEMQGFITGVDTNGIIFLTHGGKIRIHLDETLMEEMRQNKNSLVRLRGCLLAIWDSVTRRMRIGEIRLANASVNADPSEMMAPFNVPQKSVDDLLLYDFAAGTFERVRMTGQVLAKRGEEFFMLNGVHGLRFEPREASELKPGELVEVAGIPELGGPSPVLREAVVRRLATKPLPEPVRLNPEQIALSQNDALRVRVDARLNGVRQVGTETLLDAQAGGAFFSARLRGLAEPLHEIAPGSRVELTGVYVSLNESRGVGGHANPFEILLSSAADVKIIARPPWWTLRRLLAVTGGLFAVLMLAALWITQLRRRVEERTMQLQHEMREREHAEQQRMVAEEKSRIARDLHDDLGSSLTEIGLQADVAQRTSLNSEQATQQFGVIADKTRAMVSALDVIVWAVDPEENTVQATADYLVGYAEEFLLASGLDRRFKIPVQLPAIPVAGHTRHGLFLAVKETLNNIVRHASATSVEFSISLTGGFLEILISDNGVGFERPTIRSGHGLDNLQKRLETLGGTCHLESTRGAGTKITMKLPLKT